MEKTTKFWMVIRGKENAGVCVVRHDSLTSAENEAERLCRKERIPFFVLETVSLVDIENSPVVWNTL